MRIKYYKLKIVVCSVVLLGDVHKKYMWWIMTQTGERRCSLHMNFRLMRISGCKCVYFCETNNEPWKPIGTVERRLLCCVPRHRLVRNVSFMIQLYHTRKSPSSPESVWTCWKPRLLYTSKEKLRLFILQMKCCWYLLYTRCTSHIAQRLQSEKLVCCRQNRQQRTVFWMEISYTWNCRVNGPSSLLQRHTHNCAAATRGTMVVSSLINFILQCSTCKCKTRYLLRLTYPIHTFSLRNFV
jgi:hypothetical protein